MNDKEKRLADIERKYLGPCIDQVKGGGGRTLIESFYVRSASGEGGRSVLVVKDYASPIRSGSTKWPDMRGCRVYAELDPAGTFDGLEAALEKLKNEPVK